MGAQSQILKRIKQSYKIEIDIGNDKIYIVICDEHVNLDTVEKLKDSLICFREIYPKLINILEENNKSEEIELINSIPILQKKFIEREAIYKMIDNIIFENRNHALIQGLGGVGKSILATQYAERLSKSESYKDKIIIRTIDSSSIEKIKDEFNFMANLLKIDIDQKQSIDSKYIIESVYAKLSKSDKIFLFIFDNLYFQNNENDEKSEQIQDELNILLKCFGSKIKILVTTRYKNVNNICKDFELIEF